MDGKIMEKLRILADSAKYDASCSTSGVERRNNGKLGSASCAGICHSWAADGRCISLLKVLFSNNCVYDCAYCVNRRSADVQRISFEPEELAQLTIEFYRRNYIEGLFLSSAVEVSPDYTAERICHSLWLLRHKYEFAGYIHAKIIPGVSEELVHRIGMVADRVSVNIELPTEKSLRLYAPQKKGSAIFAPMKQITNRLIEEKSLRGPGVMFKGQDLNVQSNKITWGDGYIEKKANPSAFTDTNMLDEPTNVKTDLRYLNPQASLPKKKEAYEETLSQMGENVEAGDGGLTDVLGYSTKNSVVDKRKSIKDEKFAPAGQTTQMIVGAAGESDRQIIKTSESLYRTFKMKRVYFSAYIPVVESPALPSLLTPPPLAREHRLYQADWLLRFYGFTADEIVDEKNPFLEEELDPKISWALRNIHLFPMEVNKVSLDELLRIPGIGATSAFRIVKQRKHCMVKYEDLKKMGVVLKRARFFLTCGGKYYGGKDVVPEQIRNTAVSDEKIRAKLIGLDQDKQLSLFDFAQIPQIGTSTQQGVRNISGNISSGLLVPRQESFYA